MKFGKELTSQMVQEWQDAYMDYNHLKAILKDILNFRRAIPIPVTPKSSLKRRVSLYRAFSGLTARYNRPIVPSRDKEDEVILVSAMEEEEGHEGNCQTMFLMSSEEGGEKELMFFRRLDFEFNKVVKFYKAKVEEVVKEAEVLNEQMDAFIALRVKVDYPVVGSTSISGNASSVAPISSQINGRKQGMGVLGVIQEVEMSSDEKGEDKTRLATDPKGKGDKGEADTSYYAPASVEVLDHVKVNVEPETPVSTLQSMLMSSKSSLSFSKEELRKIEEQMRQAFIEFYKKLRLLKSYCFLNQLALSKIMKKYDKITSRKASKAYLEMVDKSYLGRSDEVTRLIERVEATFTKHFSNGNRSKGMNLLRPTAKREKHRLTFTVGFLTGCSLALVVAVILVIHGRNLLRSEGRGQYMENIFPLYSLFGFIVLHMLMFAANIYFWRRFRINYAFIFGFKQGTELGYREVLLLSSGLSVITLAAILSNLEMDMDPRTRSFSALTELVPLGLVIVVLLIMFCPFNIVYHTNRFFLIQCVWHCLCAPLYKVTLPDFFLADQLTSQVQAFRSLEFYVCYYGWGDFKRRSNSCHGSDVYKIFYIIVAIIPYWSRCLQCVRRLFDERDKMHALNGLKYMSIIVAVVMRTGNDQVGGMSWKIMAGASSGVATIVATYWDIVIDWGLLRKNSRNPWLRDKLIISNKFVYFVAIVILGFREAPFLHRRALVAIVACLEIIRRGIWNFFRLENEHLNNVGKFRAFKSVPLPFSFQG
ncbi:hypothetical protein LguiA_030109 [Lonicera macranthoides]